MQFHDSSRNPLVGTGFEFKLPPITRQSSFSMHPTHQRQENQGQVDVNAQRSVEMRAQTHYVDLEAQSDSNVHDEHSTLLSESGS
ncbi:MAG: hypothetical protein MHM6MM_009155 [Cercozoa sp. M6MM]